MPETKKQSANDELVLLGIAAARALEKAKARLVQTALIRLERAPALILDDLRRSGAFDAVQAAAKLRRLETFSAASKKTLQEVYGEIWKEVRDGLLQVAKRQSQLVIGNINAVAGGELATGMVDDAVLRKIVNETLVQGAPLKEWFERQAGSLWQKSVDAARAGMVNEASAAAVKTAVTGAAETGVIGSGAVNQAKVAMDALLRTATQQVTVATKLETLQTNSDVVKGFLWVSVLDNRTTNLCNSLNGKAWDLDYKPIGHKTEYPGDPPLHWNCRSTVVPVLKPWSDL